MEMFDITQLFWVPVILFPTLCEPPPLRAWPHPPQPYIMHKGVKIALVAFTVCLPEAVSWIAGALIILILLAFPDPRAFLLHQMDRRFLHGIFFRALLLLVPMSVGLRSLIVTLCRRPQQWRDAFEWVFCQTPSNSDFQHFYTVLNYGYPLFTSFHAFAWHWKHPIGRQFDAPLDRAVDEIRRQNPYVTSVFKARQHPTPEEEMALARSRWVQDITLHCTPQHVLNIFYSCPPIQSADLVLCNTMPDMFSTVVRMDIPVDVLLELHVAMFYVPYIAFTVSCNGRVLLHFRLLSSYRLLYRWERCRMCLVMTGSNKYI